jgi:hypothetical protein
MTRRLLAFQIDGVESLNNVLLIGMTNRKDLLDEALLRLLLFYFCHSHVKQCLILSFHIVKASVANKKMKYN